jgi:hypothetical protein
MEIVLNYSQIQLDSAISFISLNNQNFLEKDEEIRQTILEGMAHLAQETSTQFYSTMGFTLIADREFESVDSDENVCRVEILVDPSIHLIDEMDNEDIQSQTLETKE